MEKVEKVEKEKQEQVTSSDEDEVKISLVY
jgi:hypothetical protein